MRSRSAVVLAAGLLLTACASPTEGTPTAASTSASAPAVTTTPAAGVSSRKPPTTSAKPPAAGGGNVIGPVGYGKIKLGMSYADVRAAGGVNEDEHPEPGCFGYDLVTGGNTDGNVFISKERGVEAIAPIVRVRTPEGIAVGATVAKVRVAYPAVDEETVTELGRGYTPLPGNEKVVFRIAFDNGVVETISLQWEDQSCYE